MAWQRLELLMIPVLVCLVLGSRATRDADSGTKALDELLDAISNSLAANDKCMDLKLTTGECKITNDCLKITCTKHFLGKEAELTVIVNRCDDPVTVTLNVNVKEENIDWTYVFTSGEEVAVKGLSLSDKLGELGLYIKVELEPTDDELTLKVTLQGKAKVGSLSVPISFGTVSQKLPISTEYCGFVRWWQDKNTAVRIVVVIVFLLVVLAIITGGFCCCCCCCCKPCRGRSNRIV